MLFILFETNIQAAAIAVPDAAILWDDRPYRRYEQIRLDFRQYFEVIVMSNNTLENWNAKNTLSKNNEINSGASSYKV